jgi:hypothetical protein
MYRHEAVKSFWLLRARAPCSLAGLGNRQHRPFILRTLLFFPLRATLYRITAIDDSDSADAPSQPSRFESKECCETVSLRLRVPLCHNMAR